MARTSVQYNLISAILAFFLWGSWAYYINKSEVSHIGFVSGVTQGVASFVTTLIVVYIVTSIYNFFPNKLLRLLMPTVITVACIGGFLILVHSLAGTPRILATVSPSLAIGSLFCVLTTYKLGA